MKLPLSIRVCADPEMLLMQDAKGVPICPFHTDEKSLALKLAAAPELYDALEHAVAAAEDSYGDCGGYAIDIDECRAALLKANPTRQQGASTAPDTKMDTPHGFKGGR